MNDEHLTFTPEETLPPSEAYEQPALEPGTYTVQLLAYKPHVMTRKGLRAVVDFEGIDGGCTLWIRRPDPDNPRDKGNLNMFHHLANALGHKAMTELKAKDSNGFSRFDPGVFKGHWVEVDIESWGVAKIRKADPNTVKQIEVFHKPKPEPETDTAGGRVASDDIPF